MSSVVNVSIIYVKRPRVFVFLFFFLLQWMFVIVLRITRELSRTFSAFASKFRIVLRMGASCLRGCKHRLSSLGIPRAIVDARLIAENKSENTGKRFFFSSFLIRFFLCIITEKLKDALEFTENKQKGFATAKTDARIKEARRPSRKEWRNVKRACLARDNTLRKATVFAGKIIYPFRNSV